MVIDRLNDMTDDMTNDMTDDMTDDMTGDMTVCKTDDIISDMADDMTGDMTYDNKWHAKINLQTLMLIQQIYKTAVISTYPCPTTAAYNFTVIKKEFCWRI